MNFWLLLSVLSDPLHKGIPYILEKILGTQKGDLLAGLFIKIIEDAKAHDVSVLTEIVNALSAILASEQATPAP